VLVPRYSRRFVSHVSLNAKETDFVSIKGNNKDDDDGVFRCDEELLDDPLFSEIVVECDFILFISTSSSSSSSSSAVVLPPRGTTDA
jgi:ABC-type histidine transport system ATPase subunit